MHAYDHIPVREDTIAATMGTEGAVGAEGETLLIFDTEPDSWNVSKIVAV